MAPFLPSAVRHPAAVISAGFATMIALGTALLSLPIATASGDAASVVDALFTATSAVCVTGLVVVDTGNYWSGFGQAVILGLIQIGGLGIMTAATVIAIIFFRRTGLQARIVLQAETKAVSAADLRRLVRLIVGFTLVSEAVLAAVLTVRFATEYDSHWWDAAYSGIFHSVSAFSNAGFSIHTDNLMGFVTDPWVLLPVSFAVILGGIGFPVVFELRRNWRRPREWSALTQVSVAMTLLLTTVPTFFFLLAEADNPSTIAQLQPRHQLLASFFSVVMTRTAGFNAIDIAAMRPESVVLTDILMFIGGGSSGTAGGIKITTLGVLLAAVLAEVKGRADVEVGRRRLSSETQRQALTIVVLAGAATLGATLVLQSLTSFAPEAVAFEAVSAFGTVGLSMGITADMPVAGKIVLALLMFIGRVGPLTFASAMAARSSSRNHRRPEERMSIG